MESVVIKVSYEGGRGEAGSEIRRFPGGEDPSYSLIHDKVIQVFPELQAGPFSIYWKDSDGDLVVCSSEDELKEALISVRDNVLKLYISDAHGSNGDMNCNMDDITPNPECEMWGPGWRGGPWGGRGMRRGWGGRGMRRGWGWRSAAGMPMEGVHPHVFSHWMKRKMKRCHGKGKHGSKGDNQNEEEPQRETTGGDNVVNENDSGTNDTRINIDDNSRKHHCCRSQGLEHSEDNVTPSGSSDDDMPPEVGFPVFPGMSMGGPAPVWRMMGVNPAYFDGRHGHGCERDFHGFHGRHGNCHKGKPHGWKKGCMSARGRDHGQCFRKRCRRQQNDDNVEKENDTADVSPAKEMDKAENDVITME